MSVVINGKTLYTASEVSAMTPSGTVDSQWETYDLPIPSGVISNWDGNKFHVNKITGLVVGWLTMAQMYNMTNQTVGTNANLGIHADMPIKYSGNYEYGEPRDASASDKCPDSIKISYKEMNGIWNTTGTLSLEGEPTSNSYIKYYSSFIEHYCHIGSKYGKITKTDIEPLVYLPQGTFYTANTADLICGKAWLRFDATLPSGYTSGDYVCFFKNLWSGEVIMQYSLHPTTAGSMPSISIPTRCAVLGGRNFYTDIRYVSATNKTAVNRQNSWMRLANTTLSFGGGIADAKITWATGSLYYPSAPEVRPHNISYEVSNGLYLDGVNEQVPSASSNKFPSATTGQNEVAVVNSWITANGYSARSGIDSWTWRSIRTGMVFNALDLTINGNYATATNRDMQGTWHTNFQPSYRYNATSGTTQPLYFSGAGYLGSRLESAPSLSEYCTNIQMYTGKSLGVADATAGKTPQLRWGTSANMSTANGSLTCYTGQYLGNYAGNIVR